MRDHPQAIAASVTASGAATRTRPLGFVQKQIRFAGFRPASVERKSVERRSAFESITLYAQTLHALRALAGHNVRLTPKVWKLFLHELLARKSHSLIEQRSGDRVRRLENTELKENAPHRFF